MTQLNGSFSTNLRRIIDERKTTISAVAEHIGITRQAVSQYCDGTTQPNAETITKIAKYFNVSADWLLGLTDNQTTDEATKELCATLGLSDSTIEFLQGRIATANEMRLVNDFGDIDLGAIDTKGRIDETRRMFDYLANEMINVTPENGYDPFLVLLNTFIERLALPQNTIIISSEHEGETILTDRNGKYASLPLDLGGTWDFNIKDVLLTSDIQKINSYLFRLKQEACLTSCRSVGDET